jgi:hypothetical protein
MATSRGTLSFKDKLRILNEIASLREYIEKNKPTLATVAEILSERIGALVTPKVLAGVATAAGVAWMPKRTVASKSAIKAVMERLDSAESRIMALEDMVLRLIESSSRK